MISAHAQSPAPPGSFDYYALTLSWSPEFCYGKPADPQCSQPVGFVVHGLWPERRNGSYPVDCPTRRPAPSNDAPVAGIMPQEIVEHEWQAHGTCSDLNGDAYLGLTGRLARSIRIPDEFRAPARTFILRSSDLKAAFARANPQLRPEDIALQLHRGYLSGVKICFSRSEPPAPTACADPGDTRQGTFRVAGLRAPYRR